MKKITLLAAILVASINAKAQNFYTFTKSEATYEDLTDAVSMNNGEAWLFNEYGPFQAPFPLYVFGHEFNEFWFLDDEFSLSHDDAEAYFFPTSTFLMDRNPLGTSQRSEEHTSELQSRENLVCRLLLEQKKN